MEWKIDENRIYSVDENGNLVSEVTFNEQSNGIININHVYVIPKQRGAGIASKTMDKMAEFLKDNKFKATASCSYANAWLKNNKDKCTDIISDELLGESIACSIKGKH